MDRRLDDSQRQCLHLGEEKNVCSCREIEIRFPDYPPHNLMVALTEISPFHIYPLKGNKKFVRLQEYIVLQSCGTT
jgi:hypothetical protein